MKPSLLFTYSLFLISTLQVFASEPIELTKDQRWRVYHIKNRLQCMRFLENDFSDIVKRIDWAQELFAMGLAMDAIAAVNGGLYVTNGAAAHERNTFLQNTWLNLGRMHTKPHETPDYWGVDPTGEFILIGGIVEKDYSQTKIEIKNARGEVLKEWLEPAPLFHGLAKKRFFSFTNSVHTEKSQNSKHPEITVARETVSLINSVISSDALRIASIEHDPSMNSLKRIIIFEQIDGMWQLRKDFSPVGTWKALGFSSDNKTLIVLDDTSMLLRGYDLTDGTQKWKHPIPTGYSGSKWGLPSVHDLEIRGNRAFVLATRLTIDWLYQAVDTIIPIDLPSELNWEE